jgi:hypothetical protein
MSQSLHKAVCGGKDTGGGQTRVELLAIFSNELNFFSRAPSIGSAS